MPHSPPLACQSITFGPEQGQDLETVFAAIAAAGYDGVEVGYRHFAHVPAEALRASLDRAGLRLVASHIGGNLQDTDQARGERSLLRGVLDTLGALGVERLMYSGLRFETPEQFAGDLGVLCSASKACADAGVRLLYHNHDWEFADGRRVMDALLAEAPPELGLCPDVGWVAKGGQDVLAFLDETAGRIGALHLKDFATLTPGLDTVLLGRGVVPLAETVRWARAHKPDGWIIAEQDQADMPAEKAVAANARALCGWLDG